jgi:uncharacterized protein YggE
MMPPRFLASLLLVQMLVGAQSFEVDFLKQPHARSVGRGVVQFQPDTAIVTVNIDSGMSSLVAAQNRSSELIDVSTAIPHSFHDFSFT